MVKYSNAAFALVALFAALSMGPTPANGLSHMQPQVVRRQHHIGSEKMVRKIKRQGGGGGIPILGGGENSPTTGGPANTDTATGKPSDTAKGSDTTKPTKTSDTTKPTNTANTNTASNTSASNTSNSNTSTSNSSTNNASTNTPTNNAPTSTPSTGTPTAKGKPTIVVTQTDPAAAATNTEATTGSAFSARTWIILGSIVGGIIVIAALWTVIRKWKFSPSRRFEDRLEPIDWQPEQAAATGAAAGAGGAALARSNSHGSQRSNPTADEYHNRHMYAPNAAPEYPPDMYGGAAYADMHRGGTPQPQMDQLGHGPVYARGPYDGYDNGPAPYHQHQHTQDPYGGYAEQEYGAPAGPYRGY